MVRATDIHSLTDFTRNAKSMLKQIKETRNPLVLTVNGEAEVVIQDVHAYQQMVDELQHARLVGAILEGEQDIREGRVQDLDEAFEEITAELGLPR